MVANISFIWDVLGKLALVSVLQVALSWWRDPGPIAMAGGKPELKRSISIIPCFVFVEVRGPVHTVNLAGGQKTFLLSFALLRKEQSGLVGQHCYL